MKVIPPLTITDLMVFSSTIPENIFSVFAYSSGTTYAADDYVLGTSFIDEFPIYKSLQAGNVGNALTDIAWWQLVGYSYEEYSSITTYALGKRIQNSTTHKVYESLQAANISHALTDAAWWLELGPTNKWSSFDLLRNTQTIAKGSLSFTIRPGQRVDSIALMGLEALSAVITVDNLDDALGITYTTTIDLNTRFVASWYEYFFAPFSNKKSTVLFDLPPYSNSEIVVTLSNSTNDLPVAVGAIVLGLQQDLGSVQYNAVSDVLNFSTVNRDFAGGTSLLVQRRNVPKTLSSILTPKEWIDRIRSLRDSLNAIPAVWAGLDDNSSDYFESLLILGFYKKFSINLAHHSHAVISLELEEI